MTRKQKHVDPNASALPSFAFKDGRQPKLVYDQKDETVFDALVRRKFQESGPSMSKTEFRTVKGGDVPYSAGINPDGWHASFTMREGLAFPNRPELLRYLEQHNIVEPIKEMVRDTTDHEIGHWEYPRGSGFGCPFDKPTLYTTFAETVHDELKKSGKFTDAFCESYAFRGANLATDTINNWNVAANLAPSGNAYAGMVLFFYLQGIKSEQEFEAQLQRLLADGKTDEHQQFVDKLRKEHVMDASGQIKFSPEYELFVRLNLAVWGTKSDYQLLSRFFNNDKELGQAVSRLRAVYTPEAMGDKAKWEELTRKLVKELIPFLDEKQQQHEQTSAGDKTADNSSGQSGGQSKGNQPKDGQSEGDPSKDGKSQGKGGQKDKSGKGDPDQQSEGSEEEEKEDSTDEGGESGSEGSGKGEPKDGKKGSKNSSDAKDGSSKKPGSEKGYGSGKDQSQGDGEAQDGSSAEETKPDEIPHVKIDKDAMDRARDLLDRLLGKSGSDPKEDEAGEDSESQDTQRRASKSSRRPGDDLTLDEIEQIMSGRRAGQGIPFFLETDTALDAYYDFLVKKIPLKSGGEDGAQPVARFPLIPLLRRPFDPFEDDLADADGARLYFDPSSGRAVPSVVTQRLPIDIPIRLEKGGLPKFIVVLIDSSTSMMGEGDQFVLTPRGDTAIVPWGNESYYHYSILMVKGIIRYFQSEHVLHKIDVRGGLFSDQTLSAKGWEEFKHLMYNPLTGGTRLNMHNVMNLMRGATDAVFPLISDGEIENWRSIKSEFIALAKRHKFFMIQIGRMSQTASDMEAAGLRVILVDGYQDIVKTGIDLTAKQYRGVINEKMRREAEKYKRIRAFDELPR